MVVDHSSLAQQVYGAVLPARTVEGALGYLTALLEALPRSEQAGYLLKPAGENIAPLPDGTLVSVGRVCYPDGQIYKVMIGVPEGGPEWADDGFVDPSRYRAFAPAAPPADGDGGAGSDVTTLDDVMSRLFDIEVRLEALRIQSDANTEKIQQQIDQVVKNAENTGRLIAAIVEPLFPGLRDLFGGK